MAETGTPRPLLDPLPGLLPARSLSLLVGASGVGKTALLASIVSALQSQSPLFGVLPSPLPGLAYIGLDRGAEESLLWFEKAGVQGLKSYFPFDLDTTSTDSLATPKGQQLLLDHILDVVDLPLGGVILLDPVMLFLGTNLLDYQRTAAACIKVRRALRKRGLTGLGIAHAGKQKGGEKERYARLQDRISGSGALSAFTSTQMYLAHPSETTTKTYQLEITSHVCRPVSVSLKRSETTGLFELPAQLGANKDELSLAQQSLLLLIPYEPGGIALAQLVGLFHADIAVSDKRTIHRKLKDLEAKGHVVRLGRGLYARRSVSA